jgi:hypothetical protein
MSTETNSNFFKFYESLIETRCNNLYDEIAGSMEEHGRLMYINFDEKSGRSVTTNEFFECRAKDESKSVFKEMKDKIASFDSDKRMGIYNEYISEVNQMTTYLRSKEFLPECFANELESVKDELKIRFNINGQESHDFKIEKGTQPKLRWLGKTNVLAGLFYDLWQGQEKERGAPRTKRLIEADKKDLVAFLINNFTNSKGEPLSEGTIDDYLNSSKPEKRPKEKVRIEIMTP